MKPLSLKTSTWLKRVNRLTLVIGFGLWVSVLMAVSACAPQSESADAASFQLPWPTAAGKYKIQRVRVESMTSPETLQGRFVRLMVNPFLENGQLRSATPIGRFIQNRDGVWIPSDYASLQAATIHAHYERLAKMDRALGLKAQVQYPVRIGIRANVTDQRGLVKNNAIYDQRLDALLIVPYSKNRLPIAMNAGVLAHEHFHRIFQQRVLNRFGDKGPVIAEKAQTDKNASSGLCDWPSEAHSLRVDVHLDESEASAAARVAQGKAKINFNARYEDALPELTPEIYNSFLLRGLNEGLADFWGWVYTGDPGFIEPSLPEIGWLRRLDTGLVFTGLAGVPSLKGLIKDPMNPGKILPESLRYQRAYEVGTRYARFLRELTLAISPLAEKSFEARLEVAQIVASSLEELAEAAVVAKREDQFLSPNAILKPVSEKLPVLARVAACKVINDVAAEEEGGRRPQFCGAAAEETPAPSGDPT